MTHASLLPSTRDDRADGTLAVVGPLSCLKVRMTGAGVLFTLALGLGLGCAPEEGLQGGDAVEVTSGALGEANCGSLSTTPDATLSFSTSPLGQAVSSPTTYNNPRCSKAWVIKVQSSSGIAPQGAALRAHWTDTRARSKTDCVNGSLSLEVMTRPGRGRDQVPFSRAGLYTVPMRWSDANTECEYPEINVFQATLAQVLLVPGQWYVEFVWRGMLGTEDGGAVAIDSLSLLELRLAANALTPRGSTQSVTVNSAP